MVEVKKHTLLIASLFLLLNSTQAIAAMELGLDVFFSDLRIASDELSLRSRTALYFGGEQWKLGPLIRYEPQHSYLTDLTYGLGIRMATTWVFEADFGLLRRDFSGQNQKGFAGGLLIGWNINHRWRISLPFTVKRTTDGEKRWSFDYVPHFGLRFLL